MTDLDYEHMNQYLDRIQKMKAEETYASRRTALRRFATWLGEFDLTVTEAGPTDIEDFLAVLGSEGYAPNTINTYFDGVHHFYSYLTRDEVLDENPASNIDYSNKRSITSGTKKHNETDLVYVTEKEKEKMVEHAPTPKFRNRLILRTLWQCGLRAHELASIRLENIDRDHRSIRVYSSKTDGWRTVFYQQSLDILLNKWLDGGHRAAHGPAEESDFLFPSKRTEQIARRTIGKVVFNSAKNAGCQELMYRDAAGHPKWRVTPHAFRHGHAVAALSKGIDIRTLQKHLGHTNLETTMKYLQFTDDDVREEYQKFGTPGAEQSSD